MKLVSMRCSNKFRQDADDDSFYSIHFHSADKKSMAVFVMKAEGAEKYQEGRFYEFSATEQETRAK